MRRIGIPCAAIVLSQLATSLALAQQALQVVDLTTGLDGKCTSLENIGDVDADGIPDLAIASSNEKVAGKSSAGRVRVRSGANGAILLDLLGTTAFAQDGLVIAGAGDLNADGHADLWLTAFDSSVSSSYVVRAISGQNGAVLLQIPVRAKDLAGGRDVSGDGIPDIVLSREIEATPFDLGTVEVYSGATGVLLLSHTSPALGEYFPPEYIQRVSWLGDINGNGVAEIAIGSMSANGPHLESGMVRVIDGATGVILRDAFPTQVSAIDYGQRIENVGDLDGDGFDDLAVRYQHGPCNSRVGRVDVLSIATGAVLRTWSGAAFDCAWTAGDQFGLAMAGVGDVDGDAVPDVLIGMPGGEYTAYSSGGVQLYSGRIGQVLSFLVETGPAPASHFGRFVCAMGDLDGDNRGDFAIEYPAAAPITVSEPFAGQIWIYSGEPDSIESYGSGCPNSAGLPMPVLGASIPSPNSLQIQLSNANPSAQAIFAIGSAPDFHAGVGTCPLLVQPLLLVLPFLVASNGTYSILAALPPSLQMSFSLQALIHAPGLLGNIASSNGLQIAIH